jgi:radical SAM superfamily enzyme with C-terminal helix-hairpin-helix motif
MSRNRIIIDCYTDEPSGLGVPPFLGIWPRYIAGSYRDLPIYLTIDDIRLLSCGRELSETEIYNFTGKTKINLVNKQYKFNEIKDIVNNADQAIIVCGIQTPGKYLSANPGSIAEITKLLAPYKNLRKIITGPCVKTGSQQFGGQFADLPSYKDFDELKDFNYQNYVDLQSMAINGASLLKKDLDKRIVEIETGRGCSRTPGCSFCTEPLKNKLEWRDSDFIIEEIKKFTDLGYKYFRLGKQACIYSYKNGNEKELEYLLKNINALNPKVLHIDNANPKMVNETRTKLFVKYLTAGSTAAMGIESFDEKVVKANNLNSDLETSFEAIRIINKFGADRDENGNPKILPGINLILGLKEETEESLEKNFKYLKQILDEKLLIRRINIRQVVPFPGTDLYNSAGFKFLNKNKYLYKKWTEKVRQEIDNQMLKNVFPKGIILKDLYSVCYEGNVTFLRQFGSYPIIVGIKKRLPINQFFSARIIDHNIRSLEGELVD